MADLQNKKADITYAQLFQMAPNMRKEALKILHPGRVTKGKLADFCLNRSDEAYTISIYCDAQVNGQPIILILDSGSFGCFVSAGFLKDSGIRLTDYRQDGDKKIKVPTEYCKPANIGDRIPRNLEKGKAKIEEEVESANDVDDSSDDDKLIFS
ncbi:6022_t:CDS:2 [Ambispora leptoticha]|uniref:6022_t:CDS:1 n=1 Tax=Ambispora leptoticha TaxID=144679 RepID=A0A9N9I3U4_9GLOM|nr:6022_t:CDS:2 [Ambispora leptoticha]